MKLARQRGEPERRDVQVWKKSVDLYKKVCEAVDSIDHRDQFSLAEQVRRAALSISTNIAEGTGREGDKEAKHLFNIAKGSVHEVVSLLFVMNDKGYLKTQNYELLYQQCDETARVLNGLLHK